MVSAAVPNPPLGFSRVVPHLGYYDVAAAARFLGEAFGFRERIATRHQWTFAQHVSDGMEEH